MIADSLASVGASAAVLECPGLGRPSDDAADYRLLPVIVRGDQSSRCLCAVPLSDQPADLEHHYWLSSAPMARMTRLRSSPLPNEPPIVASSPVSTDYSTDMPRIRLKAGAEIIHLHKSDSRRATYPTHNRGVTTGWQVCDNRRFPPVPGSMAAVLNILDLIAGDDPADDCLLPVVVRGNQSPIGIVQFQCWIAHRVWNSELTELRAYCTQNHPL